MGGCEQRSLAPVKGRRARDAFGDQALPRPAGIGAAEGRIRCNLGGSDSLLLEERVLPESLVTRPTAASRVTETLRTSGEMLSIEHSGLVSASRVS
jgi:hypothetical protein